MRLPQLASVLLMLAASLPALAATSIDHGIVLDGVTVVDTGTGHLTPRQAVVIADAHIVRIAPAGSIAVTGSARRLDARGKFVVPGFLDMHAHPLEGPGEGPRLDLMLANGITGYRQMSGSADKLASRRAGTLTTPDQPSLLALPGEILTKANAATPAAAIAEIERQKANGADFIKLIDVTPPTFAAVFDEASKQGLTVSGHLPANIDVRDAAARGMRSVEHLGPQDTLLLACSSDETALRAAVANAPQRPMLGGPTAPAVVARILANPMAFADAPTQARLAAVVASFDPAKCRTLAALLKAHQTWQVPTLIRLRTMELGDDAVYVNDPHLIYVAPPTHALWTSVSQQFAAKTPAEARATMAGLFALQLKLVKLFDDAGVPMLAGSDAGGGWDIAGFSLHQEFDLLASAGLTPLRILQLTTLDGATFLERSDMGRVAAGKVGDLVVLDANPLASVANLHRIYAVIHNDRVYDRAGLDAMLAQVAAGYQQ